MPAGEGQSTARRGDLNVMKCKWKSNKWGGREGRRWWRECRFLQGSLRSETIPYFNIFAFKLSCATTSAGKLNSVLAKLAGQWLKPQRLGPDLLVCTGCPQDVFHSHGFLALSEALMVCRASTYSLSTQVLSVTCHSCRSQVEVAFTQCQSRLCKKHRFKVKGFTSLLKAEAWTWKCAAGTVCASMLWRFCLSLDGEQQHTRTKGKLGRELPPEWPFSPFAGGGGKPLSFIGSRTQVSKWENKMSGVKEGVLGLCEEKETISKTPLWEAAVALYVLSFVTSAGLGGVFSKIKQDTEDRWAKTLPRSVIKFLRFFTACKCCLDLHLPTPGVRTNTLVWFWLVYKQVS